MLAYSVALNLPLCRYTTSRHTASLGVPHQMMITASADALHAWHVLPASGSPHLHMLAQACLQLNCQVEAPADVGGIMHA